MTATTASQELSLFGKALGPSRPGTKYPVQGNPSLRETAQPTFMTFDSIPDKHELQGAYA